MLLLPFRVDRDTEEVDDGILSRLPAFVSGLLLLPAELRSEFSFGLTLRINVGECSSIFAFFAKINLRTLDDNALSRTIQALFH